MKEDNSKLISHIVTIFFIALIFIAFLNKISNYGSIKNNVSLTVGEIVDVSFAKGGIKIAKYRYSTSKKLRSETLFYGETRFSRSSEKIGKKYMVVYSTKKPSTSYLDLSKELNKTVELGRDLNDLYSSKNVKIKWWLID